MVTNPSVYKFRTFSLFTTNLLRYTNGSTEPPANLLSQQQKSSSNSPTSTSNYEPYWRDPAFYQRRFGGTSQNGDSTGGDPLKDSDPTSEPESVPSEPRQSPQSAVAAARDHFHSLANRFESSGVRQRPPLNSSSSLSRLGGGN